MPNTTTAVWPTLTAGKTARASDVEAKFDYSEHNLWPHSTGTRVDNAFDLGDTTTAAWRAAYLYSINATSTARGLAIGTTTVLSNSDVALEIAGTRALLLPRMSTTQINNLIAVDGLLAYNTTTAQLQVRRNGAWVNVGGTVFATRARTVLASGSALTTTLLNITGGGGKLIGLAVDSTAGSAYSFAAYIQLDSVTVATFSSTVDNPANSSSYLAGAGVFGAIPGRIGDDFIDTSAGSGFVGDVGWDFASTLTIYVRSTGGAPTLVWHAMYAQIV